jgi:hypothetical protein
MYRLLLLCWCLLAAPKEHVVPAAKHKAGHIQSLLQYLVSMAKRLERQ